MDYSQENRIFTVFVYPYKYEFGIYDGVYARDFSEPPKLQMYRTIQEAESLYSKKAVELARGVRELMLARGVTSTQEMIRTLQAGAIEGCQFLPAHARLAHGIYGQDQASLRGKAKRRKPMTTDRQSFAIQPVRELQWLYIDLFFICGFAFLISVSKPLDMVKVSYLKKGKAMHGVLQAVLSHISSYVAHMFVVAGIKVDSESSIVGIRTEIEEKGVKLEVGAKGEHVGVGENNIGTIKEKCRAIISLLCFKLTGKTFSRTCIFCGTSN